MGYQDNFLRELVVDNFAAEILVRANLEDLAYKKQLRTMKELEKAVSA